MKYAVVNAESKSGLSNSLSSLQNTSADYQICLHSKICISFENSSTKYMMFSCPIYGTTIVSNNFTELRGWGKCS